MKRSEYMKKIRKELGYTQAEMAELLGYSGQKDISRIETGAENMSNQVFAHLKTIDDYVITPRVLEEAKTIVRVSEVGTWKDVDNKNEKEKE